MLEHDYTIEIANWQADMDALKAVRTAVFIVEQRIPEEDEWDADDALSVHVLARDASGRPIGTGRLTPARMIGRMAVLRDWRGKGVGDALMRTLIEQADARHWPELSLHAQTYAIPFYERHGFVGTGPVFDECGIPHQLMRRIRAAAPERPARPADGHVPGEVFVVASIGDAQSLVDRLLADARYKIWIYSRDLDRLLLDREPVLDAIRRIATSGRRAEIRILLQDPLSAVRDGHRLLNLAARLPTAIEIRRVVDQHDLQYAGAFVLNDEGGYYQRPLGTRWDGEGNTRSVGPHGQLLDYFREVWQRAEPDPELRRMAI
jgi:predicted GNAT family N-acyltransferase